MHHKIHHPKPTHVTIYIYKPKHIHLQANSNGQNHYPT
ncbi:hypothetical protein F383_29042 [Gossypium arboreum]|uniref:Uncharacterized protein n=1 Tax=Gossypium arboreum TaxID=29729 RepID=A0A0B0MX02_GOSAR|nr:hypothetical protein F383_29042 [Gossypium arboreum]